MEDEDEEDILNGNNEEIGGENIEVEDDKDRICITYTEDT